MRLNVLHCAVILQRIVLDQVYDAFLGTEIIVLDSSGTCQLRPSPRWVATHVPQAVFEKTAVFRVLPVTIWSLETSTSTAAKQRLKVEEAAVSRQGVAFLVRRPLTTSALKHCNLSQ